MKKTKILLIIIILPIAYLLIFVSNFSGICKEEGKKLTNIELLKKSADKSHKENPYCCDISEGHIILGDKKDLIMNLSGIHPHTLRVLTMENSSKLDKAKYSYNADYYAVDQCGNILNDWYGDSLTEEQYLKESKKIKLKLEASNND